MTYTLTEQLLAEQQPVVDGMCLADWQALPGFDVDNPVAAAQLIHPAVVKARTAGLLRAIAVERPGDSPNAGGFGQSVPSPCRLVVWHWWGNPVGQSLAGVVAWLRNPASYVSSTLVIAPGRAVQLLPWTTPSWANGNAWANANSITIEADPNDPVGTMNTGVELLAQLVRDGVLHPDFELRGHRDYHSTACPGAYYQWLPTIRQRVTDALKPDPDPEEDIMQPITYIGRDKKRHTSSAEEVLAYTLGNLHTVMDAIDEIRAVISGKGVPVVDEAGKPLPGIYTDVRTETSYNRVNMARAAGQEQ